MYEDDTGRRNASGCADPTYHGAAAQIRADGRARARLCVRAMLAVANALGCDVLSRIELQDRASGEVCR